MATVSTETAYKEYEVSVTGETVFPYNFLVQDAAHWELFVNYAARTDYTVTGVGNPAGGTIVFLPSAELLVADKVLFRRVTPKTQLTDFVDHDFFLADTIEDALTKLTLLIQEIFNEMFTRVPMLPRYTESTYRNKTLPRTANLALLGYDAAGNWTTYPLKEGEGVIILGDALVPASGVATAVDGALVLVAQATPLIPANMLGMAVIVQVVEAFGASNGLTGIHVGDGMLEDRFFPDLSLSPGGVHKRFETFDSLNTGLTVTVTAVGGAFDGTGSLRVTVWYMTLPI